MYYPDLGPYPTSRAIRTVGWLERGIPFPTGNCDRELADKLGRIVASEYPHLFRFNVTRGSHVCPFCSESDARKHASGCEILVPDVSVEHQYFSAPRLVWHYVVAHTYTPPQVFIDSVFAVDLSHEFDAVLAYHELTMAPDKMRHWYEYHAKEFANLREEDQRTEQQRANVRRGEHLRYVKWLRANPGGQDKSR